MLKRNRMWENSSLIIIYWGCRTLLSRYLFCISNIVTLHATRCRNYGVSIILFSGMDENTFQMAERWDALSFRTFWKSHVYRELYSWLKTMRQKVAKYTRSAPQSFGRKLRHQECQTWTTAAPLGNPASPSPHFWSTRSSDIAQTCTIDTKAHKFKFPSRFQKDLRVRVFTFFFF